MKLKALFLGLFSVVLIGSVSVSIAENTKDGKAVFTEQKCDMCHSVTSKEVPSKKKSGAIDLSNSGADGNEEFWGKYLKKENDIKGKKHPAAFKGNDADLLILSQWLASLKSE